MCVAVSDGLPLRLSQLLGELSERVIGLGCLSDEPLLPLGADKMRRCLDAIPLERSRQRVASCIIVQLTEISLRFSQGLQRCFLLGESLLPEQIFESFDRIVQLFV